MTENGSKLEKVLAAIILTLSLLSVYPSHINAQAMDTHRTTGESNNKTYETVYSDVLEISENKVPLEIIINSKDCTDGVIKVDNQEIPINTKLARTIGYAHATTKIYDFTGDGKKEVALVISGGASGAVQAIQVFGNIDGKWNEINIPTDIYRNIPKFMKKQQKRLGIKINNSTRYYRTVSLKQKKILISYKILSHTDSKIIGEIRKELFYSFNKKQFVLGDTLVIPAENRCIIKASANNKAINIKWISGKKKSLIKNVQIRVATSKKMKNAKTYTFDKKRAQNMTYKFTVKSGKIIKHKTYYFNVRLKIGKNWTKWSNTEKSKITKK